MIEESEITEECNKRHMENVMGIINNDSEEYSKTFRIIVKEIQKLYLLDEAIYSKVGEYIEKEDGLYVDDYSFIRLPNYDKLENMEILISDAIGDIFLKIDNS